jgi:ABC-type amino acid transport substrate-binding protein
MTPDRQGGSKKRDRRGRSARLLKAIFKWDLQHISAIVGILGAAAYVTGQAKWLWYPVKIVWGYDESHAWIAGMGVLSSVILGILLVLKRPKGFGKPRFARYEDMGDPERVIAVPLVYPPLLMFDESSALPDGIAVDLLDCILEPGDRDSPRRWQPASIRCGWEDLASIFDKGKYDIVATPVFATNARGRTLSFSSPIFFADIGLYINPAKRAFGFGKNDTVEPRSFRQAISVIEGARSPLRTQVIAGELSEKLTAKLKNSHMKVVTLTGTQASLASLIGLVAEPESPVDFVFAERLIADRMEEIRDKKVINLLKPAELTYPVCFAMRPNEHVLRNYINLRLMEIDQEAKYGIVGLLIEFFNRHRSDKIDLETGRHYFIRSLAYLKRPKANGRGALPPTESDGVLNLQDRLEQRGR